MSAGAGKDFLLKIWDGAQYTTVGGLQSSGLKGAAAGIEITSIDSSQAKELLDTAGIKSFTISGSRPFW